MCRTGVHDMVFLRKRLDGTAFDRLLFTRDRVKVARAVSALNTVLREPLDAE